MLSKPDTSEHFSLPSPSPMKNIQCHWQQPCITLKRMLSEPVFFPHCRWGKNQNVPFLYHPQITEKPRQSAGFPAEKEPPLEIKAHIRTVFTKLFPVDSSDHTPRIVSGTLQPHYFVLMSKMFFFLQNAKGKSISFLEKCLNCLTAPKRMEQWGHRYYPPGEGGKVKSITLMISIYSTKTANPGSGGNYLRNKSTHTVLLNPPAKLAELTRNQSTPQPAF